MAWYVESLILERDHIKRHFTDGFIVEDDDGFDPSALRIINRIDGKSLTSVFVKVYIKPDFDDPLFNDMLLVEKALVELYFNGELDRTDIEVLQTLSEGGSLVTMAQKEGIDVNMLIKRFFTACNKISYELQGHFTDAGYIKYMSDKYDLDEKQVKKMARYMQKSRRTRIRRLINDKTTY
jgi:hypothetical protein